MKESTEGDQEEEEGGRGEEEAGQEEKDETMEAETKGPEATTGNDHDEATGAAASGPPTSSMQRHPLSGTVKQLYCCSIAGAALAMGLRFAGTGNKFARDVLLSVVSRRGGLLLHGHLLLPSLCVSSLFLLVGGAASTAYGAPQPAPSTTEH